MSRRPIAALLATGGLWLGLLVASMTALCALVPGARAVRAEGTEAPGGAIRGRVVDGSAGAQLQGGASVVAILLGGADSAASAAITVSTTADGAFALTGLGVRPARGYGLVATYRGVAYPHAEPITLTVASPERNGVVLVAYEPDPDVPLFARFGHLALAPDPGSGRLHVAELWTIANATDRSWVPSEDRAAMQLELLPGATDVGWNDPAAGVRWQGDALVDARPVPPGERQLVLSYQVPYTGTELILTRQLVLPTDAFRLVVASPAVTIASEALTETGSSMIGAQVVSSAAGYGLAAGTSIVAAIRGLPAPGSAPVAAGMAAPPVTGRALAGLALGIGLAGALAAVGYGWRATSQPLGRRRREVMAYERALDELAELDARRAQGTIPARAYGTARAALVARALALSEAGRWGAGEAPAAGAPAPGAGDAEGT